MITVVVPLNPGANVYASLAASPGTVSTAAYSPLGDKHSWLIHVSGASGIYSGRVPASLTRTAE